MVGQVGMRGEIRGLREVHGDVQEPLPPSFADTDNYPTLRLNAIAYAHPVYIMSLAHGTMHYMTASESSCFHIPIHTLRRQLVHNG